MRGYPSAVGSFGEPVNAYAVEAVRKHPDKFCILGHFDLQSPDREKIVERWRERPGMLGFRYTFNQPHQKTWWTDGSLDWFWAACEKQELVVGLLAGGKEKMAAVGKIAERHPGSRCTSTTSDAGAAAAGTRTMRSTPTCPRCSRSPATPTSAVKLSGAPSTSSHPYPYKNIHDYLKRIIDTFGPDRCFWGTDITRMPISYRQCVTMFTEEMPWLKGRDLERVMGGAIVDWLGWKRPTR